jgi:hypothetical protein
MHGFRFVDHYLYYCSVICLAIASACSPSAAAELTPYEARVVASGASVYSGPGERFYPTDTLAQGDVVEVYREKPGWLAIRPPANSFSWVAASDLKLQDGGLAEVAKEDVPSRIGSRLNEKHNAVQVRLKKGEQVEVLDEENINGATWYKIAPPAGEFRWIQAALAERMGPIKTASGETSGQSSAPASATKTDANITTTAAGARDATTPPPVTNSAPSASPPAPPQSSILPASAPSTSPPAAKLQAAAPVADDLSRELAAIELRLSRMVAAPVNLWNTERLEHDTAQLLARAQTPAERDAVQVTQSKIRQFATIGQRSNPGAINAIAATGAGSGDPRTTMGSGDPRSTLAQAGPSAMVPMPAPGAATAPGAGGPYDAVGILRPVVSRRPGAPQFALVDDRGQVLSFVTPTPDMNLQPYLGRRVGVVGNRGFIVEFNRAHVTAARVTPLGDRVIR